MLDVEENSGIFTFLVGMIVIVMVAVGFSVLMDKRFAFSSGVGEVRREMETDAADLRNLVLRHESRSIELARSGADARDVVKEHSELTRKLEILRQEGSLLREKKAGLQSSVSTLESDFSSYRANYRAKTRARAVGEKLGDLTLKGGREYKGSTITKVTDVGLEIRHEHGIARIQAPDLSPALQDRFQWNDEERRLRLKEEEERLHGNSGDALAGEDSSLTDDLPKAGRLQQVVVRKRVDDKAAEKEKLDGLRHQVRGWKSKVVRLASEKSQAAANASRGNSASVPGSLETWKSRSARLSRDLAKARTELEVAKVKLSVVSPKDPLLEPDPEQ